MTCTLKTHPMATAADFPPSTQHLAICSDADLDARGLTLYDMLGATDALVTDVSSVWVDYLLLDKPIIFAFGDLEEFRDSRGYTLDPILEWLPGPVVTTMRELVVSLEQVAEGRDDFRAERERVTGLLHTHRDDQSSRRLVDALAAERHDQPRMVLSP